MSWKKMNPQNFLPNHYCQKGDCDLEVTCNTMHTAQTYVTKPQAFTCSSVFESSFQRKLLFLSVYLTKIMTSSHMKGPFSNKKLSVIYRLIVYKIKISWSDHNKTVHYVTIAFPVWIQSFFCNIMLLLSSKLENKNLFCLFIDCLLTAAFLVSSSAHYSLCLHFSDKQAVVVKQIMSVPFLLSKGQSSITLLNHDYSLSLIESSGLMFNLTKWFSCLRLTIEQGCPNIFPFLGWAKC